MLDKTDNHSFYKRHGRRKLKNTKNNNPKMDHTHVSVIWIKEAQNKLSMKKKSCQAC